MWIDLQNGWRPAVEILILAVLIYYAFRFVRGTRGWPVVIGFFVVLLALALVTTLLKLEVLRWILGSASVFIAVGAGHDSARLGAAANKPEPKEWTPNVHTYQAMVPDPSDPSGKRLMPGQKSTTTVTHRSGLQLAQLDDGRYVQFKGNIANIPKPDSIGRAPAEKEQLLIQNPTKWPDFLAKYNYLPQQWMQSQTYHDQDVARGGSGLQGPVSNQPPRNAQSGPTFIDRYNAEHGMPPPGGALSQARAANDAGTGGVGRPSTDEVESNDNIEDARLVTEEAEANGQEASQDTDPAREPGQ